MQIQVHDVDAKIAGPRHSHQRIHIGAVHVNQAASGVDNIRNPADFRFESSQRIGIGQHQSCHIGIHGAGEVNHVDATLFIRLEGAHLVAGNGHAGRVRAMRGIRNQNVLAGIAALGKIGVNHQDAGQLSLRSGGGLKGNGIHAGYFLKAAGGFVQNPQAALGQRLRRVGMLRRQARQSRYHFIDAGVVLHGAGTERIKSRVHAVVPGGKPRKVADDIQLGNFRKALTSSRAMSAPSTSAGETAGTSRGVSSDADFTRRTPLEDQPLVAGDVRSSFANSIIFDHWICFNGFSSVVSNQSSVLMNGSY